VFWAISNPLCCQRGGKDAGLGYADVSNSPMWPWRIVFRLHRQRDDGEPPWAGGRNRARRSLGHHGQDDGSCAVRRGSRRITFGDDKAYDAREFVDDLRQLNVAERGAATLSW
jgi:hypothetical protein